MRHSASLTIDHENVEGGKLHGSPTHKVVSSFGRESIYFMRNCYICIDNSSNKLVHIL